MNSARSTRFGALAKRGIDILGASAGLILLSPLLVLAALAVRVSLGSPVLFAQLRPGRGGVPYRNLKLRTMRDAVDVHGRVLPDAERLTRLGRFLRSSSIDELPALWNVLRGEMSLVGPRPLLMEYLPLYTAEQARRHEVRPGLTGWAQVNGRNAIDWEKKFDLDRWYVDNQSTLLDLRILALTALKVLRRSDISAAGEATMSRFTGTAVSKEGETDT